MFELLIELGANISIKNNQGLTPLSLAAKMARCEVRLLLLGLKGLKQEFIKLFLIDLRIYIGRD